jgi:hypothetical protein
MHSDSNRYDEAIEMKPANARKSSTGSVIDPRNAKYPATHELASDEHSNAANVNEGRMARRPSGKFRGASHGFHTPRCTCGSHPCKCGTEKASAELNREQKGIRRENVNMC